MAAKLAKKYGSRVRMLVAPPHRSMQRQMRRGISSDDTASAGGIKRDETYYEIDISRKDSKVLDLSSSRFDALHTLNAPEGIVAEANPSIFSGPIAQSTKLDNISKFRSFLPKCDPQRLEPSSMKKQVAATKIQNTTTSSKANAEEVKIKKTPMFLAMASKYEHKNSGPLSLLYSIVANRQRARVMVRYVDCVRGTLTGYLIAFDKHYNMILKDVDEVYSGRVTRHSEAVAVARGSHTALKSSLSTGDGNVNDGNRAGDTIDAPNKAKLEAQRRRCYPPDGSGGPGPAVKQRYFHQMIVRGDNVVMVWRADAERSIHPRTNKSPTRSQYDNIDAQGSGSGNQPKVGTPGSLYYAVQRWEQNQK